MYQGDIVLGNARNVVDPAPKPHPVKKNFSRYGEIRPSAPIRNGVGSSTQAIMIRVSDGLIDRNWLWNKGIIPYSVKSGDFSNAELRVILDAIDELNTRTNLNIVPKWKIQNHVQFIKDRDLNGGKSKVGRARIRQKITLGENVSRNTIMHEILHAAGAWHEQSRNDRDRHIRINWDNIQDGKESNFKKHSSDGYKVTPYDANSIMHYGGYAFSKDRSSPTIVDARTRNPVSPDSGLSAMDIDGINTAYPFDFYERISRPVTSIRTVKTTILRVQSDDRDGGRKHDIDFYMKNETGPGWDWRPGGSSNPSERFKSGTVEESDNDIYPNWEFRYTIRRNEPYAKVWLQLRDDDGRSGTEGGISPDETLDINPFPGITALELYIDTASGEIFLGDIDGRRRDENYIGSLGEDISLEGFEGGQKAYVLFNIVLE
ncbi:hypothetical protein GWK10_17665 [Spongiivirga citrea]|uniref:Peptidase M12A domain-containing protein n=2 Tax=Spongiivirga citrea TaxID=1481457 RepID=A0A6M0CU72_9FLAO|nr:hypothetical protein [Spongiivirga citrea]